MPRTGTSLLMSIIKSYAIERFKISEYFNLYNYVIIDGIKLSSLETENKIEDVDAEINYRIQLLEKHRHNNMPIKILSTQITNSIFDYVKNKYKIVMIERNKYDQLLSWLISRHTNIWYISTNETVKQPARFIVNLKAIDQFFMLQTEYQSWKKKFLYSVVVYYEDLNKNDNYKKVIEKIGLNYDSQNIIYPPQKLYSLSNKEKLIINLNEVKEYMEKINGK